MTFSTDALDSCPSYYMKGAALGERGLQAFCSAPSKSLVVSVAEVGLPATFLFSSRQKFISL